MKFALTGLAISGQAAGAVLAQQKAPDNPESTSKPGPETAAAKPIRSLVADQALARSKKPYKASGVDLPEFFAKLDYDQYSEIQRRPGTLIWGGENVGFAIEPLHRGSIFSDQMQLATVENGVVQPIGYRREDYDFGKLKAPADVPDIGFSGFRVLAVRADGGREDVAVFQGACFFKAAANRQPMGVTARALALRIGDPKGEEVPRIVAAWIEKPSRATNALVIHALLDSPSLSGAYSFTLRPGEVTIMDAECTLFTRVAIDHYGLGAMQATHLYGPMDRRKSDDLRPGVYEVSGLQMLTGRKEWLWRPIANRETLQMSAFVDENPRGFGLLQRDRNFYSFLDETQRWNERPSLWIEPIGEWGKGSVTLAEIPAEAQVNQNIVAYYRPDQPLAAGSETHFAYRQFWCWAPPDRPSLAIARLSRLGRAYGTPANSRRRRVIVEFTGDILFQAQNSEIAPRIFCYKGTISAVRMTRIPSSKTIWLQFDFDAGQANQCELRIDLAAGEKPLTETWLYRWTA